MLFSLKWLFRLAAYFSLMAVDGEADATSADDSAADEPVEDPSEAVLTELGLGDDSAADVEAGAGNAEEQKPADEAAEQKPVDDKAITDDDLKPLMSRNPNTNERFRKVTEGYKTEKERADKLEASVMQFKESFDHLRQLGFSDENAANDLVNFSEYRQVLATGDADKFQAIIADQIRQFEAAHGRRIQISASILDQYPDIAQRVENLELDEPTALEVARARSLQERAQRQSAGMNEQRQLQEQQTQVIDKAVSDVEALQKSWQSTDPDFPAILPYLKQDLEEIGKRFPPSQWPGILEIQYKSLKKSLTAQRSSQRSQAQPLRGNGFGASRPASAATPAEAVLQDLGLAE
ncbi:hypothetical protein FNL37_1775 [Methylovorus glucosotrophus]|uniref:hypothetical protein n=1 Tax=Methylovorus glucosotrophus TaxID=266009 RepID=UPI0013314C95|nr:hypothetical protein [Methylovorus glucosotrophus]KAF0844331.1 hypothetical protein FNL37_1775 [Methylovorus glucosotrophus]